MRKVYAPRFDFYIAVSDYTAAELRRALPGRKQDRLYVEPMGVDYERFSKRGRRAQWRAELVSMLGGDERTVFASLRRTAGERKKPSAASADARKIEGHGEFGFPICHSGKRPPPRESYGQRSANVLRERRCFLGSAILTSLRSCTPLPTLSCTRTHMNHLASRRWRR